MTRNLLTIAPALLLATAASAQCFETNFGTLLGTGDDTAFAATSLGINFPIGGTTYDSVRATTNGVLFLTQALGAGTGVTGTGYSGTAATMVTNLRGAAGGSPRIAGYWRDLNMTVANGAGVYLNTSIPGKAVVTWDRAVHYGQTSPVFTFQVQLFDTGAVEMFYNGTANNTVNAPIAGVSAGNDIADAGATDLSVGASGVSTSQLVYETWSTLNTFDLRNTNVRFSPNAGGGYDVTPSACVPATNTVYGAACGGASGTAYESFAANTFDLANAKIRLIPNGQGGYTAIPGSGTNFVHTAAGLGLGDDQTVAVALPSAFNYPGGTTSSIGVCSNGFLWMDGTNTGNDFSPTVGEIFGNPARLMPMWCDGVADGAINVNNVFAEHDVATNKFYVSWNALPVYGGVGGTLDLQVEFDLTTMEIEIRYGATASSGNVAIVGWTPGSTLSSADLGSLDISALGTFSTSSTEAANLVLSAAPTPVLGASVVYATDNIPAAALFSLAIVSLAETNPGSPIAGAPGCLIHVDLNLAAVAGLGGAPSTTYTINVPSSSAFVGLPLHMQSASLVPGANAAGVITSNGVRSVVNAF